MTTGPEVRRIGLDRALEDLADRLVKFDDELPVDIHDLDGLQTYTKDT